MLYGAAMRQGDPDWLGWVNTCFTVAMFGHQNEIYDPAIEEFFGVKPPGAQARVSADLSPAPAMPSRRRSAAGRASAFRLGLTDPRVLSFQLHLHLAALRPPACGLLLSLELAFVSILIGMVIGLALALAYTGAGRPVRAAVAAYVEFVRNVPLLLLVYLVFYGIPSAGGFAYDATTSFVITLSALRRGLPGRGLPGRPRRGAARPDRRRARPSA